MTTHVNTGSSATAADAAQVIRTEVAPAQVEGIKTDYRELLSLHRRMVAVARKLGQRLLEIRDQIHAAEQADREKGLRNRRETLERWVERECPFSYRSAQDYMRIARHWEELEIAGLAEGSSQAALEYLRKTEVQAIMRGPEKQEPGRVLIDAIVVEGEPGKATSPVGHGTPEPPTPAAGPTTTPNAGPATKQPGAVPTPSRARPPGPAAGPAEPAAGSGGRGGSARRASVTFTLRQVDAMGSYLHVEHGVEAGASWPSNVELIEGMLAAAEEVLEIVPE